MIIHFSPQHRAERLKVGRVGDMLTINETLLDLCELDEGEQLHVDCPWVVGPVTRREGKVHLTLILPHGFNAPHETCFPLPIEVAEDGPVPIPPYDAEDTTQDSGPFIDLFISARGDHVGRQE